MNGYFIEVGNMVDPSRVYCKKCGAQAEKKGGKWFATSGQNKELESFNEDGKHISKNNLCPDCVQTVLIGAINKGESHAE
jgi:ribosomal protein S27AE